MYKNTEKMITQLGLYYNSHMTRMSKGSISVKILEESERVYVKLG